MVDTIGNVRSHRETVELRRWYAQPVREDVAVAQIRGVVTRWLDKAFPGWVEFTLTDVNEVTHTFHEKAPVLTAEVLLPSFIYPRELWFEADVLDNGHGYATVQLRDDGIESLDGITEFTLPLASVRAIDEPVDRGREPLPGD